MAETGITSKPDLPELLERHRNRLGMTQNEFAAHIGTDPVTYSLVIRGKRKCGFAFLGRVWRAYPELMEDPEVIVWRTRKETEDAGA